MEDLCERARDIQMLKVTREIQSFLASDDYEAKKAQEIQVSFKERVPLISFLSFRLIDMTCVPGNSIN